VSGWRDGRKSSTGLEVEAVGWRPARCEKEEEWRKKKFSGPNVRILMHLSEVI
jgi:hypothetical protein